MILYNVTTKIERSVAPEWGKWMRERHIPAVMATGLFDGYRLLRILDEEEGDDGLTYAVQYTCPTAANFDQYLVEYAKALQLAHRELFGNSTVVIRTLMQVIEEEKRYSKS